jgi:succinoglycan biosynthesis protein ExoM
MDICVSICTFRRNQQLTVLLDKLLELSHRHPEHLLGVAVIDDSPEMAARQVVEPYEGKFPLGVSYETTAAQNISIARNAALEAGMRIAPWVAVIDDDCVPSDAWLTELSRVQDATDADIVTGPIQYDLTGSPKWLVDQPFLAANEFADMEDPPFGTTANALMRAEWLRQHPDVRFRVDLGRTGGEDMNFYFEARAAGVRIRQAAFAAVYEDVPPGKATYRAMLRGYMWLGNNIVTINRTTHAFHPVRLGLQAVNHARRGFVRSIRRLAKGESPQWRWCLTCSANSVGVLLGLLGVRLKHK